jgi:hypothetical protein
MYENALLSICKQFIRVFYTGTLDLNRHHYIRNFETRPHTMISKFHLTHDSLASSSVHIFSIKL